MPSDTFKDLNPVEKILEHLSACGLEKPDLHEAFRYASLPLCVVDAVFSMGVRYSATEAVVKRVCDVTGWTRLADSVESRGDGEAKIDDLLALYEIRSSEQMIEEIYKNKQRTSATNGILKADAVQQFAHALKEAGIQGFDDVTPEKLTAAEALILCIPGQSTGICFDYFQMLAGNDQVVKADRMVQRFVQKALGMKNLPSPRHCKSLVQQAAKLLSERERAESWSPQLLDLAIWEFESRGDTPPVG